MTAPKKEEKKEEHKAPDPKWTVEHTTIALIIGGLFLLLSALHPAPSGNPPTTSVAPSGNGGATMVIRHGEGDPRFFPCNSDGQPVDKQFATNQCINR